MSDMPDKIYAEPASCGEGAYSIESIEGSDETSYTRTDLVDELIEAAQEKTITHVAFRSDWGVLKFRVAA